MRYACSCFFSGGSLVAEPLLAAELLAEVAKVLGRFRVRRTEVVEAGFAGGKDGNGAVGGNDGNSAVEPCFLTAHFLLN